MAQINYKRIRRKTKGITAIRAVSRSLRRKMKKKSENNQRNGIAQKDVDLPKGTVSRLSDIIFDFIEVEKAKYKSFDYNHNPTLGALYEALTQESFNKILPPGLDLKIVSGFVYDDNGFRSGEIDRMLISGEPAPLGYTGLYECHIKNVLVVFEVKKNLRKGDFFDAYEHLNEISKAYAEYFESCLEDGWKPDIGYAAKSYAQITGKQEPTDYYDIHRMESSDALVLYTLVQEVYSPVSIIHGYGGYRTEKGIRSVFLDFLEERQRKHGFGATSIPNLISSGDFSIVKVTGMPFKSPRRDNGYWPLVASNRQNVVNLMIEIIWTKISLFCVVTMPWGTDLEAEVLPALMLGKYASDGSGNAGWMFSSIELEESTLENIVRSAQWEPQILGAGVSEVFFYISLHGGIEKDSEAFIKQSKDKNLSPEEFFRNLLDTNLVTVDGAGFIQFIRGSVHMVELEDGRYAATDHVERLRNWCKANSVQPNIMNFISLS